MSYPKTYRAVRRTTKPYPLSLKITEETLPSTLQPKELVLRIHAASLNYRDIGMLRENGYPLEVDEEGISGSCCAAEVVAVGEEVTKFCLGDHVTVTVGLTMLTDEDRDNPICGLGGNAPGVFREYAVYEEKHLVKLPEHLSWEEAATMMGVGLTAWNLLDGLHGVPKGATVLLQGTGGVSIMTLLVSLAAGIRPIITSSSDAKLENLKALYPSIGTINYKTTTDIAAEVKRLTDGKGVDFICNNVGLSSIPTDLEMLRNYGGSIALVGFLEGFRANWEPDLLMTLLSKAAKIKGILAGSRTDLEVFCAFLDEKKVDLKPLVDRVFAFDDVKAAFDYMESGSHVGKVVIKM